MAALTLASSVVTLLPKPASGHTLDDVRRAVEKSPRYLRLLESWRWSAPLWDAGVASSVFDEVDCACELASVYADIRSQRELLALKPLTQSAEERASEPDRALDAMCADLIRGGPDPGINIPIAAALDRFAIRQELCVVRGSASSVAQRAEARLLKRVCSFGVPMLARAGGGRILRMRDDLEAELCELREALGRLVERSISGVECERAEVDATTIAAQRFARAFDAWAPMNARGDDENDQRVVPGYLGLTLAMLPADAALRASKTALRAITGNAGEIARTPEAEPRPITNVAPLVTLIVREMNIRPEAC